MHSVFFSGMGCTEWTEFHCFQQFQQFHVAKLGTRAHTHYILTYVLVVTCCLFDRPYNCVSSNAHCPQLLLYTRECIQQTCTIWKSQLFSSCGGSEERSDRYLSTDRVETGVTHSNACNNTAAAQVRKAD